MQDLFVKDNAINPDMQFSWFKPRKNNYAPFSIENELKVLKHLNTLLDARRLEYTRSYDEDVALLEGDENLGVMNANALRIIGEEKRIIRNILASTNILIPLLGISTKEELEKLKAYTEIPEDLQEYVKTVGIPLLEKKIN